MAHSSHDITAVGLPARAWRWRLRASAPWFAKQIEAMAAPPEVLLVSGLVDLAMLRGLLGREIPVVLYMHESQATYPRMIGDDGVEGAVRNWSSMLAADRIWFNSSYHRSAALHAVVSLERALPEEQRLATVEQLRAASAVVYPGVEMDWVLPRQARRTDPPVILWPHRWEKDKNPDVFRRALDRLANVGCDFRLVLAGDDRNPPNSARASILHRHADRVLAAGPFELGAYRQWIQKSDIVVSCTGHEFFGIGVVEALAAGCLPVLPDDFSYPELLGAEQHRLYTPGSFGTALERAVRTRVSPDDAVDVSSFSWSNRIGEYDALLYQVTGSG